MIFQIFYHLLWITAIILLSPVYLYRVLVKKKYRSSTLARFGFQYIPDFREQNLIWLHSVSLGESQIANQLAEVLKRKHPHITLVASSTTETGQAVLKNSKHIDFCFYYPFDFSFLIKKLFSRFRPEAIIIIETDLWPNLLALAEADSVPVFLVNAKISRSSFKRYQALPLAKSVLLNSIEHFYIQCQTYQQRFLDLNIAPQICELTGNLKLDRNYSVKNPQELHAFAQQLGLNLQEPVVVFASTHQGEEQGFIEVSKNLWKHNSNIQCVIVPRHPERFDEVARLLQKNTIGFQRSSLLLKQNINASVNKPICLLVDQMGLLMSIYELCSVAVVAGSFTDKVGGHNIFEPAFFAKPIIYGPWIYKQPGFHELIQEQRAAIQITDSLWPSSLDQEIMKLLNDRETAESLGARALAIVKNSQGSTEQVVDDIVKRIILK